MLFRSTHKHTSQLHQHHHTHTPHSSITTTHTHLTAPSAPHTHTPHSSISTTHTHTPHSCITTHTHTHALELHQHHTHALELHHHTHTSEVNPTERAKVNFIGKLACGNVLTRDLLASGKNCPNSARRSSCPLKRLATLEKTSSSVITPLPRPLLSLISNCSFYTQHTTAQLIELMQKHFMKQVMRDCLSPHKAHTQVRYPTDLSTTCRTSHIFITLYEINLDHNSSLDYKTNLKISTLQTPQQKEVI